ncbi:glutamine--fructose-6-phosphate transaminase (isomerizing) [Candidatus Woesearchaeota archaeon]|nr:glutamine--fructose-6-phosphate transaminase (isomerizing) [Candidatus Woesearchaeota archaeon]
MCGIAAYIGQKEAAPIILDFIKKLEYRGYDSCGIATLNGSLTYKKGTGKIDDVDQKINFLNLKGNIGIGHTRWATHGEPSDKNAHPHFSCEGNIAIVHNGIIENSEELKKILIKGGHEFRSETDTEVVVHLIEDLINEGNTMEEAFAKTLKLIQGAFAIVAMNKNEPNRLYVVKQSSPLVLGVGDNEIFVASDVLPIQLHTNKVVYLQDGDFAVVTNNDYKIKNLSEIKVNREITILSENLEEISKGDFEHFMLKEIYEQPESIKRAFKGRIDKDNAKFGGLNLNIDDIKKIKRVVLTGCGTSWHACLIGGYYIEEISKIAAQVEYASEFRYKNPVLGKDDLLIVLSQSGETADSIAAIQEAKEKGVKTIGLVNVVGSPIARMVDGGIYLHAGHEIGVASTKTFTSHLTALYLLSIYLGRINGNLSKEKAKEMLNDLENLPDKIKETFNSVEEIKKIANKYFKSKNALYLGRHYNFPVALEGALKLKEISYIHAEGYPAAEMKHGPIALIDENMPVIVIAPEDRLYSKVMSNIQEVKSRKGKVIVVTTDESKNGFDEIIKIPKVSEFLMPIISVVPVQLLAYYIAKERNCDIDKPRNLAKSVTVE